jgi:two-component system nitrogen regulation response regulator NtrX
MSAPYVLVVDDEPDIRTLVKEILVDEGYDVEVAADAQEAREARRARRPDVTLLDIWMPDTDGISLLKEWSQGEGLGSPVLMMSGHGTVETAVEATRLGAYDFIEKPLSMAKLLLTIQRALEADKLAQENQGLRGHTTAPTVEPIGPSDLIYQLKEQVGRIAGHNTAVLIQGESGVGKEVFARFLHSHSPRAENPFVRVAVASLANQNSLAELFGIEDGTNVHFGSLESANGGTLFLTDIADMESAIQGRLLGALQHGTFLRLGGAEPVQIDVRVVAATTHDLARAVELGDFREDLYYHLNVVPVAVPALRDHPEDIPALVEHFTDQLVRHERLPYRQFSVAAQNRLRHYSWPGNIRELRNVVQRLLILGTGQVVEAHEIEAALGQSPRSSVAPGQLPGFDLPIKDAREQYERLYLEHQLRLDGSNISKVAARIGIERTHLYRKLKTLGIDPKQIAREQ